MRTGFLIAGVTTLVAAWLGPLPELAQHAFFGHMLMHMLVVALAAPLLAFSVIGSRLDPVDRAGAVFAPIPASVGELVLVWAWHAPALHHVARQYAWGLVAEQGSFLLAGLWVWLSAFGGAAQAGRNAAGVIGLLLTSMHMTLLGALLALAPRPLYTHHTGYGPLTALGDQHLGGAVMIVLGGAAYLAGGLWLTRDLLRRKSRAAESEARNAVA